MPTAEELVERLKEVRLFSGLRRPELRLLAGLVKESEEFRPGQIICQQGGPGRRYCILERGRWRVTRVDPEGRVETVRELGPGEAFGETSLLLGDVRDATVECIEPAVLLYIEKEDFDLLLEEEPRIERALRMRPDVAERRRYPRFSWLEEGELVIKVAQMGIPILLSRSGVTQMGLELARKLGVILVARAKGCHFLVYHGAEQLVLDARDTLPVDD